MSEQQKYLNRKYWDGLHAWGPRCYTCEWLETNMCLGCKGNGSGENDLFFPGNCLSCVNQHTNLCEECEGFSNHEFEREEQ